MLKCINKMEEILPANYERREVLTACYRSSLSAIYQLLWEERRPAKDAREQRIVAKLKSIKLLNEEVIFTCPASAPLRPLRKPKL